MAKAGELVARDAGADLAALGARAGSDPAAVGELRERFPQHYANAGNLAWQAQQSVVESIAGGNALLRAALHDQVRAVADLAAGDDASPLETMLATRIALCWVHVQAAELRLAQWSEGASMGQVLFLEQRLDRAQRRYLEAVRSLALVRRHLRPAMVVGQLNVAGQQVNVAPGAAPVLDG